MSKLHRIMPLAEDAISVTLTRADFELLLTIAENAADVAAFIARRSHEVEVSKAIARSDDLPVELVETFLQEDAVRVAD